MLMRNGSEFSLRAFTFDVGKKLTKQNSFQGQNTLIIPEYQVVENVKIDKRSKITS